MPACLLNFLERQGRDMAEDQKDPHLHDESSGMKEGVPHGVTKEESLGVPNSGRHESESAPLHDEAGKDQAKDI